MCLRTCVTLSVLILFLSSCSKPLPKYTVDDAGSYEVVTIESVEISRNTVGEPPFQTVEVYTPPSYTEKGGPYPVIYFLNGYNTPLAYVRTFRDRMNNAMEDGSSAPFVIVCISGTNVYDGSFYVNSSVTGNWENYITREVVPVVEDAYRVVSKRDGRFIAGYSMGGFGALNIGMRHPDMFTAVYAFAPGAFIADDLPQVLSDWNEYRSASGSGVILKAYAAACTQGDGIPSLDGSDSDNAIAEKWLTGMSNWEDKVHAFSKKTDTVMPVCIVYGRTDEYVWIQNGSREIARLLTEYNLPNELHVIDGDHSLSEEVFTGRMLPFCTGLLENNRTY